MDQATRQHGTRNAYQRGCRCDECRSAQATYMRDYYRNRTANAHAYQQCSIDGCARDVRAHGLCHQHYRAARREQGTHTYAPSDHWSNPANVARNKRRHAIRKNGSSNGETFTIATLLDRDAHTCGICHDLIDSTLTWPHPQSASIDHVHPLSRGGEHTLDNTVPAHLRCNMSKGNRIE